jgi:NADH:ubiquinone oxidoreductase subunit 2 (subunit N)
MLNPLNVNLTEAALKYFKMFPAAAGMIALTAAIAFARDLRGAKDGGISELSSTGKVGGLLGE